MYSKYQNPLIERYASDKMTYIFSPKMKFSTWRKLWTALAKAEKELGLNITDEQIKELEENIYNIDFEVAKKHEKRLRHDVMAHVHAYGDVCPKAKGIIHLGATSAFVGDNTDIIVLKDALELIKGKIANLLYKLKDFSIKYRDVPTLGYTHFQPAQITTVGKRATLWMIDLVMDYNDLVYVSNTLMLRGVKGTTGTQASYLKLFNNDHDKVKKLDTFIAKEFGFKDSLAVTGQTYTRKIDSRVINVVGGIAQSLHKMTNDIRLLQNLKELEEPFGKNQIGSSAMAYKRNPMRSERISSLCKFVISSTMSPQLVAATQWFERTLDDSANRRLTLAESFLAIDASLDIANNIATNMVVYEKVIKKHLDAELPFMMTENIMMEAVKKGGDRQELHELIRVHSMDAGSKVKVEGKDNDLLERIANDTKFDLTLSELKKIAEPSLYIGRASEQVEEFIISEIDPILKENADVLGEDVELNV
ncbi:adenylosuccinate lyase [Helicovermis profundi]|uniref:Adenylosuccinate lyase n=1 Tax=Helicovermis profundi TaxID=3065157 RepID=A0AAU9E8P5_9FIRM|nr:adenylosuccinate lyase [Clostridia bacterium S502]